MWRSDNVGGLGEHVTCHLLAWFLIVSLFIFYFCCILRLAPSPHKWTDFDDLSVIRRVSAQGSAFCGLVHTAPHFGGQIQKKLFWGRE